ncbi:hypothetical protein [Micromonospora sp. C28ISP2-4]|uniref:hypothetical protein n=1 Tax=Micromonospora sp. C28ISP2-4 TaxID=3059523 RepID=UPI00267587ED|nr:hypothetical protein [Micromonospora sp. C28ISP2-4]MDO3686535.1 hypothetical protein [Micromonospora sp. C28ISP2-4]
MTDIVQLDPERRTHDDPVAALDGVAVDLAPGDVRRRHRADGHRNAATKRRHVPLAVAGGSAS